jgi:hypothetical protein
MLKMEATCSSDTLVSFNQIYLPPLSIILQRVEPLLCKDHEISKYTRDVSRQRLGKDVPAATNTQP